VSGRAQKRLAEEIATFTVDPYGYSLFAFPWGEGPLQGIAGPRRWQSEILRHIGDHLSSEQTRFQPLRIAVASGHGCGKSSLIAMVTAWALDTMPDARVLITANTERQLLTKTSPEIMKWRSLSLTRDWFRTSAMSMASVERGHAHSWRADMIPWSPHSPEAFAGLHNQGRRIVVLFDESSTIADSIWQVTEGALTDEATEIIWLALGNPTRNAGRFAECFGKYRNRWHTRHIDARTVEGTNLEYLDGMVADYGEDSDIVRVRVKGQFPTQSSMSFISTEVIEACRSREPVEAAILPSDPIIFGLDHARFGDDSTVLAIRQGRDARSRPWRVWHGANSMEIAGGLVEEASRYCPDAIFIDAGGPNAGGVIDRTRQLMGPEAPVFEINFGSCTKGMEARWQGETRVRVANKRCQMWTNMRAWLERGLIPDEQRLVDDLSVIEYGYNADNAIQLEKKEHLRARGYASSDYADALALTFAEEVTPRTLPEYLNPERYGRQKQFDRYDELDAFRLGDYDRYADL
jgi:hypothetical protein